MAPYSAKYAVSYLKAAFSESAVKPVQPERRPIIITTKNDVLVIFISISFMIIIVNQYKFRYSVRDNLSLLLQLFDSEGIWI